MPELDFRDYLLTLPNPNSQDWGDRYTPTEAELPLKVQTVLSHHDDPIQRQQETPKRYEVLAGLREYATQHVLLVGKPGSGKSTALQRLRWEEAQIALSAIEDGQTNFTIPVLIELRYRSSGSIEDWIEDELLLVEDIDPKIIKLMLAKGQFFLLFDGLNEIPEQKTWRNLESFQSNHKFQGNPRIFTTRELGTGADLGIEKKLEMLPLTEPQIRQFIKNQFQDRSPELAESLLRQLKDRLRELAETPLLLKILCDVVYDSPDGQLPQNRGELFQKEFDRRYERFKPSHTLPISGDSRRFTAELLQHLAFTMTQGDLHTDPCKPTPSWLSISKAKAERILEDYLTGRVEAPAQKAKEWLEDLLNFKLLVVKDLDHIEFLHQLFQEYYAAKKLLDKLNDGNLSNDELKQDYLNYLKWTEAIALMVSLLDKEMHTTRVIYIAKEVDLMLCASLIGELKLCLQNKATNLLEKLNVSLICKIKLFHTTKSTTVVQKLIPYLSSEEYWIRTFAATALTEIDSSVLENIDSQPLKDNICIILEFDFTEAEWRNLVSKLTGFRERLASQDNITSLISEELIQAGKAKDKSLLFKASRVGTPKMLPRLSQIFKKVEDGSLLEIIYAISSIQRRCRFYNYEIAQAAVGKRNRQRAEGKGEYEEILSTIYNMVLVMERNPETFQGIEEEALRDHFLVQLNGRYKGQATGETFNGKGKTDILLRLNGENIFIAECKFWGGAKKLKETLNQLLGYATWRDTNLALLIFNRNKDFSAVLKQITPVIKTHPSFVSEESVDFDKTWFRFVVCHPDDRDRELTLTVLAFNIPI